MNRFGKCFAITIFGESHGPCIGCVLDGVPPGLEIIETDFTSDINRRKPSQPGTTPRSEDDQPIINTGVFNSKTTGAPLTITFINRNIQSKDYSQTRDLPRPGHADFVANKKYQGYQDYRGGGHFSGRLTLPLVAAGVIAKKIINPITINSEIESIYGKKDYDQILKQIINEGDSVGGIIKTKATNMPIGLGEPFFDSVESILSHIIFSIPAIKGIEFGNGFSAATLKGSENNDSIINETGETKTNNAGGINGGITNGNDLFFRVAVKPTASILQEQRTYDFKKSQMGKLTIEGRHDACIALRMPVIIEACTAIALADLIMQINQLRTNRNG